MAVSAASSVQRVIACYLQIFGEKAINLHIVFALFSFNSYVNVIALLALDSHFKRAALRWQSVCNQHRSVPLRAVAVK